MREHKEHSFLTAHPVGTVTFVRQCIFCSTFHKITVDADKYTEWHSGAYIQRVFPNLSIDERELMIIGTCIGCWPDESD